MKATRGARRLGACCLFLGTGCGGAAMPAFAPPAADAPHAVVEVRTHYALPPADGRLQYETVFVEGLRVVEPAGRIQDGYARTVRVAPGAATWIIDALDTVASTHLEEKQSALAATCGINPFCAELLTTRLRVKDEYPLAGCSASARLAVENGGRYVLDYSLGGMGWCEITCWRRTSTNGGAESIACPAPPRPQTAPVTPRVGPAAPSAAPPGS
jgi:hypothetical protein